MQILGRLRKKRSVYNAEKWERDNAQRQKHLFNIAEYPKALELPSIKVSILCIKE